MKFLNWRRIIILILVIGIVLFYFISKPSQQKEKYYKSVVFNKTNIVYNQTSMLFLDTVMYDGLKFFGLDSIKITLKPLSQYQKEFFSSDIKLEAFIRCKDRQYIIYIDKVDHKEAISVLSHEMIHLMQYYTKELIVINDTAIWKNVKIPILSLDYPFRPWEIDAFSIGAELEWLINHDLY